MIAAHATLPDLDALEPDALKAIIVAQHLQIISSDSEIEHLMLLVAKLRRMQFGRRSEKVERQIEQLELKLEELEANRAQNAQQTENRPASTAAPSPASKPDRKRRPLPDHLPRSVQTHLPAEQSCPECGGALKKLGEDISEVLEYIPGSFIVIRQVRPRLCCGGCDTIVQAPAPSRPIERGLAGPGLLAHVLTSKFTDHLPLYRQSKIYAREGVDLDRFTLAKWVGETSQLLAPLVEQLRRYVMAADKLHADDTPVPVLAPGSGKPKPAASGPTFAMIAPPDRWMHPLPGLLTHLIAGESIRRDICASSAAFSRRTPMPVSTGFTKPGPFKRRHVWRTSEESSMTWWRPTSHRLPSKQSNASQFCMRSKRRFGDGLLRCGKRSAAKGQSLCWT
jgi:transposase